MLLFCEKSGFEFLENYWKLLNTCILRHFWPEDRNWWLCYPPKRWLVIATLKGRSRPVHFAKKILFSATNWYKSHFLHFLSVKILMPMKKSYLFNSVLVLWIYRLRPWWRNQIGSFPQIRFLLWRRIFIFFNFWRSGALGITQQDVLSPHQYFRLKFYVS